MFQRYSAELNGPTKLDLRRTMLYAISRSELDPTVTD